MAPHLTTFEGMCGRYVLIEKLEAYEQRFHATAFPAPPRVVLPHYNLGPGALAPVVLNSDPNHIRWLRFGMTPFWARKPMLLFNARSEGDHNSEDNPDFRGARGIITKPAFRKPIRSQRCLVIADAFIEGPKQEKLDKPFLVFLQRRPFAFAGIWDEWADPETGEITSSFAIITTTPNSLLQKIGHHRSPVILHENDERRWLQDIPLSVVTSLLDPYPSAGMNAYPLDKRIKHPRENDPGLLHPSGPCVVPEKALRIVQDLKVQGMGYTKRDDRPQQGSLDLQ
ncbi:MAG: SOS response-associated peptidase [Bacteroidota bacterium]